MNQLIFFSILTLTLLFKLNAYDDHTTVDEIAEEVDLKIIPYGSVVRLQHQRTRYKQYKKFDSKLAQKILSLHSHEVKYGSGSGQQSVTGMDSDHDYNSLWTIKSGSGLDQKFHMDPVRCSDVIRLEHNLSKRNLHTHDIVSPLSQKQEVSAYGSDGNGDTGDDWVIECDNGSSGEILKARIHFHLQHLESRAYLFASSDYQYNVRNCGQNCPIEGQLEIAADSRKSYYTKWKITSGLFYVKAILDQIEQTPDGAFKKKSDL